MTAKMFMVLADVGQGLAVCVGAIAACVTFYRGFRALRKKLG